MLEGLVGLMTALAFAVCQGAEVDGMFEGSTARILVGRPRGIVKHRVADVAVVSDYLAGIAFVLAIVTTETT